MSRRFLKVETERLILTCFETFIEANGKQITKTNITNKVNSISAILLYILASEFEPSELHVSFCLINFYLKIFELINAVN
jgi:hypothetical protein